MLLKNTVSPEIGVGGERWAANENGLAGKHEGDGPAVLLIVILLAVSLPMSTGSDGFGGVGGARQYSVQLAVRRR